MIWRRWINSFTVFTIHRTTKDLNKSTRWPPIKNSWTPRKNLLPRISSPKFHQNLLNHVDEEAFWAYLNNDPKWPLDDLWSQIPEHPYCPPTWWSLCPSITKMNGQIYRYTDTSGCHKLIAPTMHELKKKLFGYPPQFLFFFWGGGG